MCGRKPRGRSEQPPRGYRGRRAENKRESLLFLKSVIDRGTSWSAASAPSRCLWCLPPPAPRPPPPITRPSQCFEPPLPPTPARPLRPPPASVHIHILSRPLLPRPQPRPARICCRQHCLPRPPLWHRLPPLKRNLQERQLASLIPYPDPTLWMMKKDTVLLRRVCWVFAHQALQLRYLRSTP